MQYSMPIKKKKKKTINIKKIVASIGLMLSLSTMEKILSAAQTRNIEDLEITEQPQTEPYREAGAVLQVTLTSEQKILGEQLRKAAGEEDEALVKKLLAQGAPVNATDDKGNTALMEAVREGGSMKMVPIVDILIKAKADVNAPSEGGLTPLMCANHVSGRALVTLLLKNGVRVNQADCDGSTALFYAVSDGNRGTVSLLIFAGAHTDLVNDEGETVWTCYVKKTRDKITREQMSKIIQQAVEKRQHAIQLLPEVLRQYLPLPHEMRSLIMDYEQEEFLLNEQRRAQEKQKARRRI